MREGKSEQDNTNTQYRVPFLTLYLGRRERNPAKEDTEQENHKAEGMTTQGQGGRWRPRLQGEEPVGERERKDKRKEGNREVRKVTKGKNGGTLHGKGERNLRDL
jgi:hypothetical protein